MFGEREVALALENSPYAKPGSFILRRTLEDMQQERPDIVNPLLKAKVKDLLKGNVRMREEIGYPWPRKQEMLTLRSALGAVTLALHTQLPGTIYRRVDDYAHKALGDNLEVTAVCMVPFIARTNLRDRMQERFPDLYTEMEYGLRSAIGSNWVNSAQAEHLLAQLAVYDRPESCLFDYAFPRGGKQAFDDHELNAIMGSPIYAD
jgi:hypothetical protein